MSCERLATSQSSLHSLTAASAASNINTTIQRLVETGKYYCPFLSRGFCRKSSGCNFSHDLSNSIRIPNDYCHFFLANTCLYGPECKFEHSEPHPDGPPQVDDVHLEYAVYSDDPKCSYLHGLDCDLCGRPCLHPYNPEQQRDHRDECLKEHERQMELSFAIQRSRDKVCGICMDIVMEKEPITSSRFGILEKCNHTFCLDCIRKWRGTKQFETRTIRACPECRVSSDFVVPSKYWVEDPDDKDKLIQDYKTALKSKPCKYFNEGRGECPFAGSCFYKHAYPDGSLAKKEAPKPRRRFFGSRGAAAFMVTNDILWNILASTGEEELHSSDELESLFLDPEVDDWEVEGDTDDDDEDVDDDDEYDVHPDDEIDFYDSEQNEFLVEVD